jgi:DNA uptake protein ComE-like DNA-binding protein
LLTVHSSVRNASASGEDRINVQTATESELSAIPGLNQSIAKAIVDYRGQNQLQNIADLLEVRAMAPPPNANPLGNQPPGPQRGQQDIPGVRRTSRVIQQSSSQPASQSSQSPDGSPGNNSGGGNDGNNQPPARPALQPTGPQLISKELFRDIADEVTTDGGREQAGVVNINSASLQTLLCLPGITEELANGIIRHRSSAGYFANVAELFDLEGMSEEIFKQLAPRITTRSETFRIMCEGRAGSSGARKRIEVIVKLGSSYIDVLAYKEEP